MEKKSSSMSTKSMCVLVGNSGNNSNKPSSLNFDVYFPWACKLFHTDVVVQQSSNVTPSQTLHTRSAKFKKRKRSDTTIGDGDATTTATPSEAKISSTAFMSRDMYATYKAIQIFTTYDLHHHLTKISICNNKEVPRNLLIILSLIIKFYPALTTLTVNSGINAYSIYEISKFLPKSALREIYLDGTRLKNPNYHMLLETASHLTCLSLARCQIGDEALRQITDLLSFPLPASKTLIYLNLSSNRISDKGAAYLAEALRTNRQLACLNLTDNHINDAGASHIFEILREFPIKEEEMVQSNSNTLKYNSQRMALIAKFVAELKAAEEMKTVGKKTTGAGTKISRKHSVETKDLIPDIKIIAFPDRKYAEKAEVLATKTLGEYIDPFQSPASFTKYGKSFCVGNTALASLNLSYNNLSFISLNKLLKVLHHQKNIMQKPRGLFMVKLEGNYLPTKCQEYAEVNELLNSSLDFHQPAAKKKVGVK